jgi:prevent-host-death family protein
MRVVSSREFNQDVSQAKRLARFEPVFVTDRGRPTHVLMSIEAFRRLSGQSETIVDLLAMANGPVHGLPERDVPDRADPWRHRDAER